MDNENTNQKTNSISDSLRSILKTYDEIIEHYQFVINDLSGEVYVPSLQANREVVVSYLSAMLSEWEKCRAHIQMQLDALNGS